jgi:hypothetical protein
VPSFGAPSPPKAGRTSRNCLSLQERAVPNETLLGRLHCRHIALRNRISGFNPECEPEGLEREDPSIHGDPPNRIIREKLAYRRLPPRLPRLYLPSHLPPFAGRTRMRHRCLSGSQTAVCRPRSLYRLFLTDYCVLRTARGWLRFVKLVSACGQLLDRPSLREAATSDWLRSARFRVGVDTTLVLTIHCLAFPFCFRRVYRTS